MKLLKCYRDSVDASASQQVAEALAGLLIRLLNQKSAHWCRACNVTVLCLRLLSGVYKYPRTMDFIVACDPRCIMEREGSVALVCLREKAVCDMGNIVRVLGLLARACT